jgi:hypothetical protein
MFKEWKEEPGMIQLWSTRMGKTMKRIIICSGEKNR